MFTIGHCGHMQELDASSLAALEGYRDEAGGISLAPPGTGRTSAHDPPKRA